MTQEAYDLGLMPPFGTTLGSCHNPWDLLQKSPPQSEINPFRRNSTGWALANHQPANDFIQSWKDLQSARICHKYTGAWGKPALCFWGCKRCIIETRYPFKNRNPHILLSEDPRALCCTLPQSTRSPWLSLVNLWISMRCFFLEYVDVWSLAPITSLVVTSFQWPYPAQSPKQRTGLAAAVPIWQESSGEQSRSIDVRSALVWLKSWSNRQLFWNEKKENLLLTSKDNTKPYTMSVLMWLIVS